MNETLWDNDLFKMFIAFLGGIISGLLANWLFLKWQKRQQKKSKSEYFLMSSSNEEITFSGDLIQKLGAEDIVKIKEIMAKVKSGDG